MNLSNLYSLLNTPFYIEQQYGASQLPLLLNLITSTKEGKIDASEKKEPKSSFIYSDEGSTGSSSQKVAILNIKQPIVKHSQFCGPEGTKSMMNRLRTIENDNDIAGVVLDIDSGGGQVYGTPEFHDFIKNFSKPVVTYTDGLLCSAAYYIGSAASHIVANKRADAIGSIGVYSQILDVTGWYEKQGAKLHTIYSSKSTEKNKAYREVLEGNYDSYISEELDPLVDSFVEDMKSSRENLNKKVFKGATFNASDSLELGLIDEIGTIQTAIDKVFELSNNTQTQNTTNMKNYTHIQTALGMDAPFESNDQGVYLNEDQLDVIEEAVEAGANVDATVESATTPLNTQITTLTDASTEVDNALNAAFKQAEFDRGEMTQAEAIQFMSNKLEEYGSNDGASHTKTKDNADNVEVDSLVGGYDIAAAMNN